jgi:AcrR family transcriptional regulator
MTDTDSRERILAAALELMTRTPAPGPGLRDVGRRAGLHNSSLFHHFRGKAAILDAVAERVVEAAAARVAPLRTDDPPSLDALVDALCDLAEHGAEQPEQAAHLLALLGGAPGPARERAAEGVLAPVADWLGRARAAGVVAPVRPGPTTLRLLGLVLLEPAWSVAESPRLRPARRARRREIGAWVAAALAPAPARGAATG